LILRKYSEAAGTALRERLAYRADLVGQVLSYSIFVFIFANLWRAVFGGRTEIAGYSRAACVWYFIVAELAAFGGSGPFQSLAEEVKSGAIAYGLGRPYSFLLFQYAQQLGRCLPTLALLSAAGMAFGLGFAGILPGNNLARALLAPLSLLLSTAISYLIQACIGLTAFWLEENAAFYWIFMKLILVLGTLTPIEFLPDWAHAPARLLPTSQVAYAPARIAAAGNPAEAAALLGIQAAWCAALGILASAIYAKGAKHVAIQGG
jgi:ABC-2 type transport system permease protein